MSYERSGEYNAPEKKVKHEPTRSRKCGCLYRLRGYVNRETKECWLIILKEFHNHELVSNLEGSILVGRLRGKDEELVSGFDQEFGATKEYFNEFEGKKKRLPDEYKISVQCMSKNKNVKQR